MNCKKNAAMAKNYENHGVFHIKTLNMVISDIYNVYIFLQLEYYIV